MAKGKRAAALFEVIQAAKAREEKRYSKARPAVARSGGLRTPNWWFKSNKSNSGSASFSEPIVSREIFPQQIPAEPLPIVHVSTPEKEVKRTSLIGSLLSRRKEKVAAETPAEPEQIADSNEVFDPVQDVSEQSVEESPTLDSPTQEMDEPVARPTQPMMRLADDIIDNEEALDFGMESPAPQSKPTVSKPSISQASESPTAVEQEPPAPERIAPDHKPVKIAVDRQRQQLNLRITYTSAAIGAFGLATVIVIAFIIGRSISHGPAMAGAASIDSLRKGQPFPQVLMVSRNPSTPPADDGSTVKAPLKTAAKNPSQTAVPAAAKIPPTAAQNKSQAAPQPAGQQTAQQSGQPSAVPVFNGQRIVGMQYVWIQSYPDPEDANDAVAVLKKAGIDATAEKNLWIAPSWTTVIGTRAFDHTRNNPDYQAYLQSIQEVSENFAGTSKFKRFDPRAIGWKDQAH